ncbi:LuxR family transcriptional regulator [Streptomyces armeniacus]|uniref:LuxR family transcriptional regulator n=1 Tax=Streptomyces armeniacus TaxID=83291 RepID=A0A345XZI4_9ACTN|nr:LuxR family transcriptional regulator [Streptomyces armeniacus]
MSVFGVSPEEEETYRLFLRRPDTPLEPIPPASPHRGPDAVPCALERLCALGLLRQDEAAPSGYAAEDPETALSRLMDQRMHELHNELRRVTRIRPLIDALRAEMCPLGAANGAKGSTAGSAGAASASAPSRRQPPRGVEQLTEPAQIRDRIDDLAFFARDEILSVESAAEPSPDSINRARALGLRSLRHGVRVRSVVPAASLGHVVTAAHLRELAAEGALIRVATEVTERIVVFDGRTAVVPVDTERPERGALFAYESGLVTHIVALFERIWGQAEDLLTALDGRAATDAPCVTERERQVLESMVSVGKDESGARSLGISVRTYRRHVADLMQRLGAASRAQAALLAREHGWI